MKVLETDQLIQRIREMEKQANRFGGASLDPALGLAQLELQSRPDYNDVAAIVLDAMRKKTW